MIADRPQRADRVEPGGVVADAVLDPRVGCVGPRAAAGLSCDASSYEKIAVWLRDKSIDPARHRDHPVERAGVVAEIVARIRLEVEIAADAVQSDAGAGPGAADHDIAAGERQAGIVENRRDCAGDDPVHAAASVHHLSSDGGVYVKKSHARVDAGPAGF